VIRTYEGGVIPRQPVLKKKRGASGGAWGKEENDLCVGGWSVLIGFLQAGCGKTQREEVGMPILVPGGAYFRDAFVRLGLKKRKKLEREGPSFAVWG